MKDTCPHCLHRGNTPLAEQPQPGGSTRAVYRCACCRRVWTTDWATDYIGSCS